MNEIFIRPMLILSLRAHEGNVRSEELHAAISCHVLHIAA